MTLTLICDECGRLSEHEVLSCGFHEQIYTALPYPPDWQTQPRVGGGAISPPLDYCPACTERRRPPRPEPTKSVVTGT